MERICKFLKDAGVYYLATVEGDQPRVRPFGTAMVYEGRLYIQTGRVKAVSRQLADNPKAEICAFHNGTWVRITGELIEDDRVEARKAMLEHIPNCAECTTRTTATRRSSTSRAGLPCSHRLPQHPKRSISDTDSQVGF